MVLIPHVVRRPSITMADLASIASGAENNIQVRPAPPAPQSPAQAHDTPGGPQAPPQAVIAAPQTQAPASAAGQPSLRFEPANITIKPGETAIIGIQVQNVNDLFSIPMLLQYNPAVISVEEVRQGGFLGDGTQNESHRPARGSGARASRDLFQPHAEFAGRQRHGHAGRDRGQRSCARRFETLHRRSKREKLSTATHPTRHQRRHHSRAAVGCRTERLGNRNVPTPKSLPLNRRDDFAGTHHRQRHSADFGVGRHAAWRA